MRGQNNFGNKTCSWRCLISNKLEQLKSKLEKNNEFRNWQEKLEKLTFLPCNNQILIFSSGAEKQTNFHNFAVCLGKRLAQTKQNE